MYLRHCVPVAQMFVLPSPTDGNPLCSVSSGLVTSAFTADFFVYSSSFLIHVKNHTRSACGGMSVQKSFIIGLNVESVPQKLKPNLSEGEAPHEDATREE